ncbi:MAG: MFS transporter, partial [Clostridia bacterium]|nr:MFS transporter [Clostridia bacterium]
MNDNLTVENTSDKSKYGANYAKYLVASVLNTFVLLLASGTIIQTFLFAFGISADKVSLYASVIQIIQVAAMFFCMFFGDKIKNVKRLSVVLLLVYSAVFIAALVVLLFSISSENAVYTIVLIGSMVANFALGVYNVICYKLPYFVIDINDYGRMSSVSGMIGGAGSVLVASLLSFFVEKFDYRLVMTIAFSIGGALNVIHSVIIGRYKIVNEEVKSEEKVTFLQTVKAFKRPEFYKTLLPHFLRGVGGGIIGLLVVVGNFDGLLDSSSSTLISVFTSASAILGSLVYFFLERKIDKRKALALFGILTALTFPFIAIFKNFVFFCIFYFVTNFLIQEISVLVPVIVYDGVDYDIISKYTAFRMLLLTLGQAIPGFFMVDALNAIGSVGVMAIGGAASAASSVWLALAL